MSIQAAMVEEAPVEAISETELDTPSGAQAG